GLELGDMEHVAYATVFRTKRLVLVGRKLEECAAENASAVAYLTRVGAQGQLAGALVAVRAVARLTGTDDDPEAIKRADEEAAEEVKRSSSNQWVYAFGQVQMMVSYILGDLQAANRWQAVCAPLVRGINGLFSLADYYLFSSLLLIETWPGATEAERKAIWEKLTDAESRLRKWAECCPENFAHKFHLLSAEMARLKAEPMDRIVTLYDQAFSATGNGFLHLGALAHERQAKFWLERGNAKIAKMLLREAYHLYATWGARAKLVALEGQYPEWFGVAESTPGTSTHSLGRSTTGTGAIFDLNAVLRATQAVSSEVTKERLYGTLMTTILENAGAQRASLIIRSDSDQRLYVEASATIDRGTDDVAQALPLESAAEVCVDLVQYVSRTRETVVLDDACQKGAFQSDPYFQLNRAKSVLCLPVLHQNSLVAILYAENNAASCAFTTQRLGILQVIASQAAISISNALLYDQLEHKVEQRTAEVAQKNREIEAMLHAMDQGVFAIDEELTIQPQYSHHLEHLLGTTAIVGQPCLALMFRGAQVRRDSIQATEAALRFSFGAHSIFAEANMGHLIREFSAADSDGVTHHYEVDWNLILDANELVTKVLVVLRDVTLLRQLQTTAAQKSRETDIVGQILDCGLERFRDFCDSARHRVEENRNLLLSTIEPSQALVRGLFRNVHALKGVARLLGLNQMVEELHAAEDDYAPLRDATDIHIDGPKLIASLDRVTSVLQEYETICGTKLAPLWQRQDVRLELATRDIESAISAAKSDGLPHSALPRIEDILKRLRAVPLRQLVKDTSRALPSLAQELQKSVPAVECDDQGTLISDNWVKAIQDVLVQSFRNSLAHGIEEARERISMNKTPSGVLTVAAERREDGIRVSVYDDGRGLPLDELRCRMGLNDAPDHHIAEALFSAGISTASTVTTVSGRGVGMELVRTAIERLGGNVGIHFTGECRDGHRPFALVVSLPSNAVMA
ncbi:MAG TPA: GAF domain-containing protein, partial [Polyangiaceae bacterium]